MMNKEYAKGRKTQRSLIYRLNRRSEEVEKVIRNNFKNNFSDLIVLDVGTADGLMLSKLQKIFHFKKAIGIDVSEELLKENTDKTIDLRIGDAEKLDFENNSFDIVIATAVIEHISNPKKFVRESKRVLKENGVLIITTPNQFFDKIATKLNYYPDENDHNITFDIKKLSSLVQSEGLILVLGKRFMFFPFFRFPFEDKIENFLVFFGLDFLMVNQLVVFKKTKTDKVSK